MICMSLGDPNKRALEQMTEGWIRTKWSEIESLLCFSCVRSADTFLVTFVLCLYHVANSGTEGNLLSGNGGKFMALQQFVGRAGAVVSGTGQVEQQTGEVWGGSCKPRTGERLFWGWRGASCTVGCVGGGTG